MLSSTFMRVADFISGTVPGASALDPFSFYADMIEAPYDQLPGFDDVIPRVAETVGDRIFCVLQHYPDGHLY